MGESGPAGALAAPSWKPKRGMPAVPRLNRAPSQTGAAAHCRTPPLAHPQEALHAHPRGERVYERERIGEVELEDAEDCRWHAGRAGALRRRRHRRRRLSAGGGRPCCAAPRPPTSMLQGLAGSAGRRALVQQWLQRTARTSFVRKHDARGRGDVEQAVDHRRERRWHGKHPGRLAGAAAAPGHPRQAVGLPQASKGGLLPLLADPRKSSSLHGVQWLAFARIAGCACLSHC